MFRKSILFILLALSLFGCAAGSQFYTKDEETSIMHTLQSKSTPKLYLYVKAMSFANHMGNPFECTLDGNAVGGVKSAEYVVMPVKAGNHTIACTQGVGLARVFKVKGTLALNVGTDNLYVQVTNGMTIYSSLKLESSKTPPNKFNENYQLSKTCTACLEK